MENNKALEIKNKIEELKNEYKQYNENTEDSVDKRRKLTKMQVKIGQQMKKLVLLLKEEGYTTSVIAKRTGLTESRVRKLEG